MAHDPDVLRGLADELEAGTQGAHGLGKIAMICTKEEWALIIAALRAPQGDAAGITRPTRSTDEGNPANSASSRLIQSSAEAWPSGCIKPRPCARHAMCMYAQSPEHCRHFGKDLTSDIVRADRARALDQHSLTKNEGGGDA